MNMKINDLSSIYVVLDCEVTVSYAHLGMAWFLTCQSPFKKMMQIVDKVKLLILLI